jgi:AraC-like DNA-binding protein
MQKESLYQPFEIVYKELEVCPKSTHKHNFFELIYIVGGTGTQCINNNEFDYDVDCMFMITPEDFHFIHVMTSTKFFFIRFNESFLLSQKHLGISDNDSVNRLKYILSHGSHQPGCILADPGDKLLVKSMIHSLIGELANRQLYHQEIITEVVNVVIRIVARNIVLNLPKKVTDSTDNAIINIINYIQENIYLPEALRLKKISGHFGIAEGYLSRFFKKHSGENLQQYIINYKLKLIETRLRHSDMRINEIASELGFTDESHLNRIFKRYVGISPSDYRKDLRQGTSAVNHSLGAREANVPFEIR